MDLNKDIKLDAWFDNPDAYELCSNPTYQQQKSVPKPAIPMIERDLTAITIVDVLSYLKDLSNLELLKACTLLIQDEALFIIVPIPLVNSIRDSNLREDLSELLTPLPVHYRVASGI